ncbi:MAG: hypothetical protein QG599_1918 [Pseudomonadota bacterium]|nr:hypothetical protein [Pseudomonadota bacterium]
MSNLAWKFLLLAPFKTLCLKNGFSLNFALRALLISGFL